MIAGLQTRLDRVLSATQFRLLAPGMGKLASSGFRPGFAMRFGSSPQPSLPILTILSRGIMHASTLALALCVSLANPSASPSLPSPPAFRAIADEHSDESPPAEPLAEAEEVEVLVIQAKKLITRPGAVLEDARVLVKNGQITAVGGDFEVPEGAREISGDVVCAGFIDVWSTLGLPADSADAKASPSTRTIDGLETYSKDHLRLEALRAGVTSARVQDAIHSEIGGLGALVSNHPDLEGEELALLHDACLTASLGITRDNRPEDIFKRATEVEKLISELEGGLGYRESWVEYKIKLEEWEKEIEKKVKKLEKDFKSAKKKRDKDIEKAEEKGKKFKESRYKEDKKPREPRFDANKEVMARVAHGELPLIVEVHRAQELRGLLEKTKRFDRLRMILAGASEAMSCAEDLAERRIPVMVWPAALGAFRQSEHERHDLELAGRLHDAGVEVLLGSGGQPNPRDLPLLAAMAVGHGLDAETAFAALTLGAAETFDMGHQLGSIEVGKRADLLVLNGEPLAASTQVRFVVLNGEVIVEP